MSAKNRELKQSPAPIFLGIEAGGTRTVALAVNGSGADSNTNKARRLETGPANLRLLTDEQLSAHLQTIARGMPTPGSLAIGMAGARTESDRQRIRKAAARAWPGVPCYATNDLETALLAGASTDRPPHAHTEAQVLVLSGTGSCCFGRASGGKSAKVGGWGHILGDKGSGYEIGLRALKAAVYYYDRDGVWSSLGQRLLRALELNEPDDLIGWVQAAGKTEIAALAVEVFQAASKNEKIARDILASASNSLAKDAAACARRLVPAGKQVQFVFAGSILLKQAGFAAQVARQLKERWPGAIITRLQRESVWGAVELARGGECKVQSPKSRVQGPGSKVQC